MTTITDRWHSQPMLLLQRATHRPMRRFVEELLVQEGYFCAETVEMDDATDAGEQLAGRALALINADTLTDAQQTAIAEWLGRGGRAILLAPPDALVERLGRWTSPVHSVYRRTPPCYARFADHEASGPHAGTVVQVTTPTVLRSLEGAQTVVELGARRDNFTTWPAVVECELGQGRAAIYWFDLGTCLALMRQGDPRIASTGPLGEPEEPTNYKAGFLDRQIVDPHLSDIPQADVWADLTVSLIRRLTDDLLPLPRVWQFPHNYVAMTLLDGDSDSYDWDNYAHLAEPAGKAGVPYTLNVMAMHMPDFDRGAAKRWMEQGHDFQLHYWPGTSTPTPAVMRQALVEQQALFAETFGHAAVGGRAHTCVWPGYTDTAEALADVGHRIETNFCPLYGGCGYRGSARAARFITPDGRMVPISQQPTVFMDDMLCHDKGMVAPSTPEAAHDWIERTYAASVTHYHGVICTCLHPVPMGPEALYRQIQDAALDAILTATADPEVGALSYRAWVEFLEARRNIRMTWSDGWQLHASSPVVGCTVLQPDAAAHATRRQGLSWEATVIELARGPHQLTMAKQA
ncbi:hypothetical protein ACERK3_14805 [Phycisphaerales bacterium AB-hyl4]|uniref:Polysaccharide deacetylase n=1 Tax=Natronomicrosphaera hydrolytica TaxID=3242702 RepID=A0ABV4U8E6_9BACT